MDNRVLILRDDKNVSVNNVYKTIQVVDNNRPVSPINVIQEVTNIIQVTAGRVLGDRGDQGPAGSFPTTGSYFLDGNISSSFTGSLQGTSSYALTASFALNAPIIGLNEVGFGHPLTGAITSSANFIFSGSNLTILNTGRSIRLGGWVSLDNVGSAIYFNQTPNPQNFILGGDGNSAFLNCDTNSGVYIQEHNSSLATFFRAKINIGPNVYIGDASDNSPNPTALLHLKSGGSLPNTSPFKFTSGSLLTLVEQGALEVSGSHLYYSPSNILRNRVAQIYSGSSNTNEIPYFDSNGFLTRSNLFTFDSNGSYSQINISQGGLNLGFNSSNNNSYLLGLGTEFLIYSSNSNCLFSLGSTGNLKYYAARHTITGSIESLVLQGTGSRMVESDSTGSLSAQSQIVQGYLTDFNIINYLTTGSSWSSGSYIGPTFTGSYQGQFYSSGSIFYFAVANDLFVRMQLI
jgi:hypothetical protein